MKLDHVRRDQVAFVTKNDLAATFRWIISKYIESRLAKTDLANDGDMLLFQWGAYDWGNGLHSSIDLTRQTMVTSWGQDVISQLRCNYMFDSSVLSGINPGNIWCHQPKDAQGFLTIIETHPAYIAALGGTVIDVECIISHP